MAGLCHRLAFLVRPKTIIVIPRGARYVTLKRVVPRYVYFYLRVHRAPMASRIQRWGRGGRKIQYYSFHWGGDANKNAPKKGGRGRHYALLVGPLIIMAVSFSAPTLTLIHPNEHCARARACMHVTSVSLLPFWWHSMWSASGLVYQDSFSLHVPLQSRPFSFSNRKMPFTSILYSLLCHSLDQSSPIQSF